MWRDLPIIELEVVGVVPDSLMPRGQTSEWAQQEHGHSEFVCFLEGPVPVDMGLLLADVAWGRILAMSADGTFQTVYRYDGAPTGLAMREDGVLLIADHLRGLLALHDWARQPRLETLAAGYGHGRFRGLNDLVITPSGEVIVTDQGSTGLQDPSGRLLAMSPEGSWRNVLGGLASPNGVALMDDGSILVAVTRENAVFHIPYREDGAVTKVGRFIQLSGGRGPDGLSIGPNGEILVAHLGLGTIWVLDSSGSPMAMLRSPTSKRVTNVCVDRDGRVFVTDSGANAVLTTSFDRILQGAQG